MQNRYVVSLVLLVVLVLFSCSQPVTQNAPASEKLSKVTVEAVPVQLEPWAKEWSSIIQAAKKEGSVVIYSTASGDTMRALAQPFQKNYGISVDLIAGRGGEIGAKLIREQRAGLFLADVYIGGGSTVVTQIKPAGLLKPLDSELILPDVINGKFWWNNDFVWVDKEHTTMAFSLFAIPTITVNDTIVKKGEIKSNRDLLDPKWKGKMVMNDPTIAGIGGKWFSIVGRYIMDLDFMKGMAKQEPAILRDQRLQVEWVVKGRYPIAIAAGTDSVTEFRKAGAPISYVLPVEGTWLGNGSGGLSLIAKPPHPNAARVFANWLLTREAQSIYSKDYGVPSARLDVPTDGIDPVTIPVPGVKYVLGFREDILVGEDDYRSNMGREIFGPLLGR